MKLTIFITTLLHRVIDHTSRTGRAGGVILTLALIPLAGCQVADMAQFAYANATATHQWSADNRSTTLEFELVDNHIILPVNVNGSEPLRFVLDSGAAASVILESHHSRELPLQLGAELPVSGVGTGAAPVARVIKDTRLSLGDVSIEGLSVIYLAQDSVAFFDNLDEVYFDGVIGAPVFERLLVAIDYDQRLITFSEPSSPSRERDQDDGGWQELPLQITSGLPYLTTRIGVSAASTVPAKLLVDTGYRGPVSLTPSTGAGIEPPKVVYSTTGQGLSGDLQIEVGITDSVVIGDYTLKNLPVSYAMSGGESDDDSNGLLGNEVLSRFNLRFDYPNQRLFIRPNQQFQKPVLADRSGLIIRPHRQGAVIKSIDPSTAAITGELHRGDIITRFDNARVTDANISELKRALGSDREAVPVCWLSGTENRCGEIALAPRL